MFLSQVIPFPLLLKSVRPRGDVTAIYCRVKPFSGQENSVDGYRVISFNPQNHLFTMLNLATGHYSVAERKDIFAVRVVVTWEE
jgi:hypothetical protein